ncbi:MAG: 30S ribosomal protein S2 [Rickettsiaceae bacterium]|nr:30S ribosomal protein S2 [Rickettsiaceae bacterium]MDP4832615.1 30S ribosomal protein S2 [Rickettsiaceae bacterium]MDP5021237.1 30S ribosomal protein S2 [Rickettsiaceae bacterium]MDP5083189.1 30S ribosomal protein S2 [Rickettsiaceae bacterium]
MSKSNLPKVSVGDLLDAGIHFGHKTSRWNPKMAPYIYGVRDDIHIIDLQQTVPLMQIALQKIYETVKNNGKVLFVSGKVQATDLIAEYAEKCGQFYVNNRWLGGMLTNWGTISKSIKKLNNIEKVLEDEEQITSFTKKEILDLTRKREKLLKSLAGIRNIGGRPDLIVVIDTNREHLAISEAVKLNVPIVAVVDSNSDPDNVDYPIPGNDDAIRSIRLYCSLFADAALAGIQDALTDSGADAGLTQKVENKTLDGVTKIEKVAKVSKAKPINTDKPAAPKKPVEKTPAKKVEEQK